MAIRDAIPRQDLLRYLREAHDEFVDYIEMCHPDAIEGFLYEDNQNFAEWIECEGLGGEVNDRDRY